MIKIEKELIEQEEKVEIRNNVDEILDNVKKRIDNILNLKDFSNDVCKELVDKIIIHNGTKFDFYIKGFNEPYIFNDKKSNILSLQH